MSLPKLKHFRARPFTLSLTIQTILSLIVVLLFTATTFYGQRSAASNSVRISNSVLLRIIRAEDERRWGKDLESLLSDPDPAVRSRAALAAGRIGNPLSLPALISILEKDSSVEVRAMAAFALGEIESPGAVDALTAQLADNEPEQVRARSVEALGKIAAALPKSEEVLRKRIGAAIVHVLEFEQTLGRKGDTGVTLLALTAALRARPEGAGNVIAKFLEDAKPRVREDAANALARLKVKEGNDRLRELLRSDPDSIAQANAARASAATNDKEAIDALIRLLDDMDKRLRVSAIRALGTLGGDKAAKALAQLQCEVRPEKVGQVMVHHVGEAECLEIITSLGNVFRGTEDEHVLSSLRLWQVAIPDSAPELEIALARISPADYLKHFGSEQTAKVAVTEDWHLASNLAQGLGEIAALPENAKDRKALSNQAVTLLRAMLNYRDANLKRQIAAHSEYAIPDILRAFAEFKTSDLADVLRSHLKASDVIVRATAAELIGDLPQDNANTAALIAALPIALNDKELNDAALAILDALAKQKTASANEALKSALTSNDHLIRRRAVNLLQANNVGDFSANVGIVQTRNKRADYQRAISRMGKTVRATVNTNRGAFVIELLPDDAPMTVDNFVELAKRGYFNGITFHRVVSNFVIQGGDPRGDGNGGPGYQIRCEINESPFETGAVGMALSGKDTGGSQWFVTHSPQPHLDGGYTVFGNVVAGTPIVGFIVRGDVIRSIRITETARGN